MAKKKRHSRFKGAVSKEAHEQKQERKGYGYLKLPEGTDIFKVEPTDRRLSIDIMPYIITESRHPSRDDDSDRAQVGDEWYKRPFSVHRNVGGDNESVVCPTSIGKKCPICEYRTKQIQQGEDKAETDTLRPSKRNLYVVIPKDHKKYEEKPYIFDSSQYLFQRLLNDELEDKPECEIFPDLEEGLTIRVRFEEQSIGKQSFAQANRIDFKEREKAYDEDIREDIPDLDATLIILSYKELKAKFYQEEEEDEGKSEKEEVPSSRKKKKAEREVENDEDEDDDKDGDEDDNKKEQSRHKKKRKSKEDEDNEDDDDNDADSKEKCPHGHKFGVDTEEYDDCDDCKLWKKCVEKKEEDE